MTATEKNPAKMEGPKETIISVLRENRSWRWLTILAMFGMILSSATAYRFSRQPSLVWVVSEDRKITKSDGKVFSWEVEDFVRRAVEIFYIATPDREDLLQKYFLGNLAEAGNKLRARDRFVAFKLNKIEDQGEGILVRGTLYRENEKEEELNLVLTHTERSDLNPYGLAVTSAGAANK